MRTFFFLFFLGLTPSPFLISGQLSEFFDYFPNSRLLSEFWFTFWIWAENGPGTGFLGSHFLSGKWTGGERRRKHDCIVLLSDIFCTKDHQGQQSLQCCPSPGCFPPGQKSHLIPLTKSHFASSCLGSKEQRLADLKPAFSNWISCECIWWSGHCRCSRMSCWF